MNEFGPLTVKHANLKACIWIMLVSKAGCYTFSHGDSPTNSYVTFEVFTAMTMKNAVFWDVTPCNSGCKRFHSAECLSQ
jgi:hypothetical protein